MKTTTLNPVQRALACAGVTVVMLTSAAVHAQQHLDGPGQVSPLIVGGNPANTADWPFFTQLLSRYGSSPFCGASYIGDGYVLTAAHCVDGSSASSLNVKVAGFSSGGSDGDRIGVSQVYVHPNFASVSTGYDVALLKLARLPNQGQAVTMAQGSIGQYANNGDLLTVAGLGRLSEGGSSPSTLYEVDVPLVSDSVCRQSGGSYNNVGATQFCAGYSQGQKDACQGDSGGPIVINSGGQRVQLGIVSWGIGCARPNNYGVYADVADLRSWIDGITGGSGTPTVSLSYTENESLGNFTLGETQQHTFTITNTGSSAVTFNTVSLSSAGVASTVVKAQDSCSAATLPANQSCSVGVEFGASAAGSLGVTLDFSVEQSPRQYSAAISANAVDGGSVCKGNWDANTIYYRRDQVTYNGYRYQARWWTQGDVPSESGPWGVWRRIGSDPACQ
tara:strand:+ start:318 stop:1658 length:1341 start_codon:yes stop_codon:yes gene_type:complete